MTAVENLVEETRKLCEYSLKSFEEGFKEFADTEKTIQALIDIAINLQQQLSNLITPRIEPSFPIEEEKNETSASKDEPHSIQYINNSLNIGPVSICSLVEALKDKFADFNSQKSGIEELHSPSFFLEEPLSIKPDIIDALAITSKMSLSKEFLQKKVTVDRDVTLQNSEKKLLTDDTIFLRDENLHADLKKSALIINKLNTIYGEMASTTAERNLLISEKTSALNRSVNLLGEVEKEIKNKEISRILDVNGSSDKIHHFSEILRDTSTDLCTNISEAYKNTETSSLNEILARTFHSGGAINSVSADACASRDTIPSSNPVSYFDEALDNISKTLHQSISKTHEITDISVLNKIQNITSQPAELTTSKKKPALFSDKEIFEIPALKPRKKILTPSEDSIANTARLSNAIEMRSHEREKTVDSRETITYPFAKYTKSATSSQSVSASSVHVTNAFETISDFITTATGIDRQMSMMMGQDGTDVNTVLRWSGPLDQMFSEERRVALNLHKIALENSGTTQGRQIMDIGIGMAPAEALEQARLSALNNISMTFPQEEDYRIPSPSMMPPTIENILQIMPGSQREPIEGHTETRSVNFQNTFNIVVNVKNGGNETELRDLGKKIGQVLSDEIRRYGGIR